MDGTAEVIPFRSRRDAAPKADAAAQERLARALALLDAALLEQQTAMDQFRLAIGDLSRAVSRLETGLLRYGDELSCLEHDLERLAIEARALEAWADEALARPGR
jgi:glutathione S-transferase